MMKLDSKQNAYGFSARRKQCFCTFLCVTVALFAAFVFFGAGKTACAEELLTDGTYTCTYRVGGTSAMGESMIGQNIDDTVKAEVQNGVYYVSVSYKTSSGMSNLSLNLEGKVGSVTQNDGSKTTITYTLSEANVQRELPFSVYVSAMDRTTNFTLKLNLSSATKVSDTIEDIGERPAEFVPVITTNASVQYGVQSGAGHCFVVPAATAKLGGEDCPIAASVVFNGEVVEVADGKFMIERAGTYILTYRAESEKYKTSQGNNTFAQYVVAIDATAEASEWAKFASGNVPDGLSLVVGIADENSALYALAGEALKDIAVKYSVFTIEITDRGEAAKLNSAVEIDLKADPTIDRTKVEVYRMADDGKPEKLPAKGAGRYVRTETDCGGTFVVCEAGVQLNMPRWGWAVIIEAAILVLGGGAFAFARIHRRKNTEKTEENSETMQNTEE